MTFPSMGNGGFSSSSWAPIKPFPPDVKYSIVPLLPWTQNNARQFKKNTLYGVLVQQRTQELPGTQNLLFVQKLL